MELKFIAFSAFTTEFKFIAYAFERRVQIHILCF